MNPGGKMKKKLQKFEKNELTVYIADGDFLTQKYFNEKGYEHTGNVYVFIESIEGYNEKNK